jgi:hypothetical protein
MRAQTIDFDKFQASGRTGLPTMVLWASLHDGRMPGLVADLSILAHLDRAGGLFRPILVL